MRMINTSTTSTNGNTADHNHNSHDNTLSWARRRLALRGGPGVLAPALPGDHP